MNTKNKTLDVAKNTIQTNFWGTVYVIKYFGPLLDSNSSRIVNISSGDAAMNVSKMSESKKKSIVESEY